MKRILESRLFGIVIVAALVGAFFAGGLFLMGYDLSYSIGGYFLILALAIVVITVAATLKDIQRD